MDYRQLIEQRRNQSIFEFYRQTKEKKQTPLTNQDRLNRNIGGMSLFIHGKLVVDPTGAYSTNISTSTLPTTQGQVLHALDALLAYNASISLGPTLCARAYYLWFFSIATATSWVSSDKRITGTKDLWNWSIHNPLTEDDTFVWLTHMLIEIMPQFVSSYDSAEILQRERARFNWTTDEQDAAWVRVSTLGGFTEWSSAWASWFAARAEDGSVEARVPPTTAEKPNGTTYLEVTRPQDFTDRTAYPQVDKWTPLEINGVKKNYLTYGWGSVRSSILTPTQEDTIQAAAATAFLGTSQQRTDELISLLSLVTSLTDEQKMIAEFWAGGPNTVAPPGISIWFWKQFVTLTEASLPILVFSGFDLAIHLFEASRLTWALKRQFMESRPIQEIRKRYAADILRLYDGTDISGSMWRPFQMPNFVTPPFPDFPSGHSTFSQALANVMIDWFSESIPSKQITVSDLHLLSPIYHGEMNIRLTEIPIQAKSSEIEPGAVPASDLVLRWSTWQELAESAGVSRQYGGIHAASAHTGGQLVSNTLHPILKRAWNIRH